MNAAWALALALFLLPLLGLHLAGLPGNWLILGAAALFAWLRHPEAMNQAFFILLGALALAGELIELAAQYLGTKRYGGSSKGNLGALLGAFAGAVLGAPFLLGLGALAGALAGAFFGCYLLERLHGMPHPAASQAAKGAFFGRALGLTAKIGLGAAMIVLTLRAAWPA
ncbi:MAG: DUF456 domain-containing protein [Desulfovibrionaceae bacterium]|nr:DUF456 domain-containing protein [Desulfovibrionaceae bacterium]MBF0514712.1 DUF456 domain-containing protein [Desulfovibrionaceae bacterium]